jgi:hypothetical protein
MIRKPDEVTWANIGKSCLLGWDKQEFFVNRITLSIFLGSLVLRWHFA